jgi:hypothetical protein
MGFPLHRGTIQDGILTCHWHHARFDLASGGTFDLWADDVPSFPVEIRDGSVWVNLAPPDYPSAHQRARLRDGLERNLSLVIAKAVIRMVENADALDPFRIGLEFGARYRKAGWGQGLTIHTCMINLLPYLEPADRSRALYQGLSAVADDSEGMPPRFAVRPLPDSCADPVTLKRWFRRFVEVRDTEGAERCLVSAIEAGAGRRELADMLYAAASDHRYIDAGHALDFTTKALESLDALDWERSGSTDMVTWALTSLPPRYTGAARMEESNAWRNPVDLISMLEGTFDQLPGILEKAAQRSPRWNGQDELVAILLADNPQAITLAMLDALRAGFAPEQLAETVTYAAARRIAHFHTSNEFGDWDTALHTFTFANAVLQGMRRAPSAELLRAVFDAAMSVYLDRFLNVPAAPLPEPEPRVQEADGILADLPVLLNQQQQVNEAGRLVARYLYSGANPGRLMATLGKLLLREDRNFHTIQAVEAAFRLYEALRGRPEAVHVLVAAARYVAAHAPTMRAQGQTFQIAYRLWRGENLFEGTE